MTSDISGTSLCCEGRANQASKTETQAATVRVICVTCSAHVLIFAVIGHYTINILKIFQMFTVFMSLTVKIQGICSRFELSNKITCFKLKSARPIILVVLSLLPSDFVMKKFLRLLLQSRMKPKTPKENMLLTVTSDCFCEYLSSKQPLNAQKFPHHYSKAGLFPSPKIGVFLSIFP